MLSPVWPSSLCLCRHHPRLSPFTSSSWRARSTLSAIKHGIRAGREDGEAERGGRDRSRRSIIPSSQGRRRSGRTEAFVRDAAEAPRRSERDGRAREPSSRNALRDRRFGRDKAEGAIRESSNALSTSFRTNRSSKGEADDYLRGLSRSSPRLSLPGRQYGQDQDETRRKKASDAFSRISFEDRSNSRMRPPQQSARDASRPFRATTPEHARTNEDKPRNRTPQAEASETGQGDVERSSSVTSAQGTGLLRHIKSACRSVQAIREREANGSDVSSMTEAARSFLDNVNEYVTSGSFRDEPAQAVASLFWKKAPEGIFITGKPRGGSQTVIYQKLDGSFDLSIGNPDLRMTNRNERHSYNDRADETYAAPRLQENRLDRPGRTSARSERDHRGFDRKGQHEDEDDIPVSIPYTTAASEFLYGYNAVLAALRGGRRKLYRLYIHPKIFEREMGSSKTGEGQGSHRFGERPAHQFVSLAKEAKVPFQNEFNTRLLDKMSGGRPHNGLVLEASKLPVPPVTSLGKPDQRKAIIPLHLSAQTAEEAAVNGTPEAIQAVAGSWRYPLVVLLDGILDEGNLGNIIRTCYFYGVDAIAVAKTCAPLSLGVMAKASSGACEAVRLLAINEPSKFVFESAKHRWKIYASVAPAVGDRDKAQHVNTLDLAQDSPLAKHPCILMLGSEGHGLRENLKRRADRFVSINKGGRPDDSPDIGLDSLNVTVATGVLLESFLTKPASAPERMDTTNEMGF